MSCIELVDGVARRLHDIIKQQPNITLLETEDFGWENYRYTSPAFRLAHLEIFNQSNFLVVHCCVFPHVSDPSPIFGFDVIAGENKITGVFMDLSPVALEPQPFINISVEKARDLPEWGDIFSPYWLACRPNEQEMIMIGYKAGEILTNYLQTLGQSGNIDEIRQKQNYYCLQQQKNPHTKRALVNLVGSDRADYFMKEILFPCT
jgi:phycocyanobilin:ferredoxin oxidoreductase